jgi:hypothetical protein
MDATVCHSLMSLQAGQLHFTLARKQGDQADIRHNQQKAGHPNEEFEGSEESEHGSINDRSYP